MRISEAKSEAVARLIAAATEGAGRDAERILAAVLGVEPGRLRIMDDRELTEAEIVHLWRGIEARARRQPVAQITGFRDFYAHRFKVTRDTLDPRPETEALVEAALALPWASVLDMGTGTGAILISLLAARPGSSGMATDISEAALDVARENAHLIGVTARFARSDWFEGVSQRFDLIVSNPPYIALEEMAELSLDVRDWEPHSALTDGADGLTAYRAIAAGAADHLTRDGHVLVEIGHRQGADVAAIFRAAGAESQILPDLDGRDRVVMARFPG
jgi:release factor glutamine methyltransferase